MLISSLQQFLRLLAPPLAAAGINQASQKSVTASLESLAEALEPFREMHAEQLAEFLKIAQGYRETGQIPEWALGKQPKPAKAMTPKASKAPQMSTAEAVEKLRGLQERSSDLSPAAIAEEVRGYNWMTVTQLKDVQKGFLGAVVGKNKGDQLAAIQKKIDSFRASRDRVGDIFAR